MTDTTTEPRREFEDCTRDQLIAEIKRLRAELWHNGHRHDDTLTAVAPVVRAALAVNGNEHGPSTRDEDFDALMTALDRLPWALYDALGIKSGEVVP